MKVEMETRIRQEEWKARQCSGGEFGRLHGWLLDGNEAAPEKALEAAKRPVLEVHF